jgi:phosphohistidine phosphatase
MEIYLLRHGIAEDQKPGMRDADRALTDKGVRKLRAVLERAREAGVKPSLILTSPYRRARETAEVAHEILGCREPIEETERLIPSASPDNVWEEIRTHRQEESLLLAGHEPLMSALYAHLLGTPSLIVQVKKASLGCISMEGVGARPRGALFWLITPAI